MNTSEAIHAFGWVKSNRTKLKIKFKVYWFLFIFTAKYYTHFVFTLIMGVALIIATIITHFFYHPLQIALPVLYQVA